MRERTGNLKSPGKVMGFRMNETEVFNGYYLSVVEYVHYFSNGVSIPSCWCIICSREQNV